MSSCDNYGVVYKNVRDLPNHVMRSWPEQPLVKRTTSDDDDVTMTRRRFSEELIKQNVMKI